MGPLNLFQYQGSGSLPGSGVGTQLKKEFYINIINAPVPPNITNIQIPPGGRPTGVPKILAAS